MDNVFKEQWERACIELQSDRCQAALQYDGEETIANAAGYATFLRLSQSICSHGRPYGSPQSEHTRLQPFQHIEIDFRRRIARFLATEHIAGICAAHKESAVFQNKHAAA